MGGAGQGGLVMKFCQGCELPCLCFWFYGKSQALAEVPELPLDVFSVPGMEDALVPEEALPSWS